MITIAQDVSSVTDPVSVVSSYPTGSGGSVANGADFLTVQSSTVSGAATWTNYTVSTLDSSSSTTIENLSPGGIDYSIPPLISRIAGNQGIIRTTDSYGFRRYLQLDFNYSGSSSYPVSRGYVSGSIPKFCFDDIVARLIEGKDMNLFSSVNHAGGSYSLNADCWAAAYDFSGVSVWNSRSGDFRQVGTAITRRHLWMAWHYRLLAGDTVKFRRSDGTVDTYTVVGTNPGSNYSNTVSLHENVSVGDICIVLLDRDLHTDIAVYPIAEWAVDVISLASTPPGSAPGYGIDAWAPVATEAHHAAAMLHLNQSRDVSVVFTAALSSGSGMTAQESSYGGATIPYWYQNFPLTSGSYGYDQSADFRSNYSDWTSPVVGGDSSSPIFCPTGDDGLAIASCFTTANWGMAPSAGALNAIIAATDAAAGVSTGYTVTVAPDPTL